MSQVTEILEEESVLEGKATLVRRVSDMFKDGSYSGPPLLFRHASMKKLRHCCQNLNLFPYLLYSYDNSKSHPMAQKVNVCISELLRNIVERFFFLYKSVRLTVLQGIQHRDKKSSARSAATTAIKKLKADALESQQTKRQQEEFLLKTIPSSRQFSKHQDQQRQQLRERRKSISLLLTIAIYLAPMILAFQVIALCGVLIFDKYYTPGFVFLVSVSFFLGGIHIERKIYERMKSKDKKEKRKEARFIITVSLCVFNCYINTLHCPY